MTRQFHKEVLLFKPISATGRRQENYVTHPKVFVKQKVFK